MEGQEDLSAPEPGARPAQEANTPAPDSLQGQPIRPQQATEPHDAAGVHERGANA
jgi:two-component system sensor histidine kinase SenX3